MSRFRIASVLVVLVAFAAIAVGSASAATPTLQASVSGDSAFKISLKFKGKPVKTLKAGKYKVVVKDPATIHNFRLTGKGLNKATSVSGKGTFTWTVTLKKGKYTFDCDPHKTIMHGSFTVK
ncbi:MAG TPA: cupredoxin domain-containing protein [Gaiellaceae bacterium]|jgi:plastocyanin